MAELIKRNKLGNRHWRESHGDGVIKTEMAYQPSEGKLYVETTQPNKRAILENNRRLASLSDRHTTQRRAIRIPEEDFPMVVKKWPTIVKGTNEERQQALTQIMAAHPEWAIIKFVPKYHEVKHAG